MKYTIRTVSSITGLSQYTIRAWERRHHVLSPERTETNRRIYDENDVIRLQHLKEAVDEGYGIGQSSQLTNEDLEKLCGSSPGIQEFGVGALSSIPTSTLLEACLSSIKQLEESSLRESLNRSATILGVGLYIDEIVIPLLKHVELGWTDESLTIAQEHLVSVVLRSNLDQIRTSMAIASNARRILVTTPKGQSHEIGAQIISVIAGLGGWHVTYLGPNLPAEEIVIAAKKCGANAIALSLVYPGDDSDMGAELSLLREGLGPSFPILIGGRVAHIYVSQQLDLGFIECYETSDFRVQLVTMAKEPKNRISKGIN